jgi:actin-related protein 6
MTPNRTPKSPLLVIDSGHSHTTITPVFAGRPIPRAIRRLDIGGKFLTNYLREIVSLRHYDLRDEPHLLNEIKEDVCYVCTSPKEFSNNLVRIRKSDPTAMVDYVLPDYENLKRGFSRPHDPAAAASKARRIATQAQAVQEDVIPLGNERFVVPELLFNPRDVGMQEAGLSGAIAQVLEQVPQAIRAPLLANVKLVGGSTKLPGVRERLEYELRQWVNEDTPLRVELADDPVKATWLGGAKLASDHELLKRAVVTRAEYLEHGANWLHRKFAKSVEY